MSDKAKAKPPVATSDEPATGERSGGSKLAWIVGWLLVPGLVFGGLFGIGVHVGARHPDMFLTRGVLWMTKSEAQRGPKTPTEAAPLGRQYYLKALPKKEFGMSVEISEAELADLAPETDPAALACETLCERVWAKQRPDKILVETTGCKASDDKTKLGTLECELVVER